MRPLNASAMTSRLIALYDTLIATAAPNDRGTAAR
jgi:hypothetical protein